MTICQNYLSSAHVYNSNSHCLNKFSEAAAGLSLCLSISCPPARPFKSPHHTIMHCSYALMLTQRSRRSFNILPCALLWSQVTLWATTKADPSPQKTETTILLSLTVPCPTKEPGGTRTATGPTSTANTASPDTVRSVSQLPQTSTYSEIKHWPQTWPEQYLWQVLMANVFSFHLCVLY